MTLMRHEKVKLHSDGKPISKSLVQKTKDRYTWSQKHTTLVEDTPLYSFASNGRAEKEQFKRSEDWPILFR